MSVLRKSKPVQEPARERGVVASAARYTFGGAQAWQGTLPAGDRRWQVDAWLQYDQCGELRYATGWKANACSEALMYAAEIDPDTGRIIGPAQDPRIQAIASGILGGPTKRPQHIRTLVINLDTVGEVYTVIIPPAGDAEAGAKDAWLVVSGTEVSQQGKGNVEYTSPDTGAKAVVKDADTLIRIWNPHPRLQLAADSPVRAALPILREIEKSSQNIAARLDSRLASANIMLAPQEADYAPDGDADPEDGATLVDNIRRSMSASLRDPGTAAAQVPIIIEAPYEYLDGFRILELESPLSKEIIALRADAIARFAASMDLPREVIEGMGTSNHWSAWQVAEETWRTHLLPTLGVIADAYTEAYLKPMAIEMGVPDVDKYVLAFDASDLIGEPDPVPEALEMFDRGLITGKAVLKIANIPEDYAPTEQEKLRSLAERLVTAAPALFAEPVLRQLLGFSTPTSGSGTAPAGQAQPAAITASTLPVAEASLAVRYALERAGNRMLNTERLKAEFAGIPRGEAYLRLKPDARTGDLLEGAWRLVPEFAARWDLDGYTRMLISQGFAHSDELLRAWMARRG